MALTASTRREFITDVGRGMLVAGLGGTVAHELGLSPAWAEQDGPERLTFGEREWLVSLMQETPADRLLPMLVELHRSGTSIRELVGAAALANARGFGGEDYIGFHAFMSLMPAYRMAMELPRDRRVLPVLKVTYRSAQRLQESGKAASDVLRPVSAAGETGAHSTTGALRRAIHGGDTVAAEHALAAAVGRSAEGAWNELLPVVHEAPEVHRIVLAHRAWDMLSLVGMQHAETMLRQSVRFCLKGESPRVRHFSHVPDLLAKTLEQHGLVDKPKLGTRQMDDGWIAEMTETLFKATPDQSAAAVAAALQEGIAVESLAEAISLTANLLVLRDPGRSEAEAGPNKPAGSVHGDSIGVHASDSAHAWRHVASFSDPANAAASLVLAGWHVAHDRTRRGGWDDNPIRPLPEYVEGIEVAEPAALLQELDGAIREQNQEHACAVASRYLDLGHAPRPVLDVLLRYAISEDGALHAEKYYWTVVDEYQHTRAAFRNRHIIALARVTASQYGTAAPGYEEARQLLSID